MVIKEEIISALKDVYDPEIPINVYDLGLIYEINLKQSGNVHIVMTLTSPTCPTADYIQELIHDAVSNVKGVKSVDVELTFEPMWTPARVAVEAKEELGMTDDFNSENLSVQNTFEPIVGEEEKLRICFNCGTDDSKLPIISCYFKGEMTNICSKCLSKFN